MPYLTRLLIILILVLFQVTIIPINFAFVFLFTTVLFIDKFSLVPWLVILSLLTSLFGNLNIGITLIGFSIAVMALEIVRFVTPKNNLTKVSLILLAFPISNLSLLLLVGLLQ